ncbi:bifunctional phosphoribosylaminoimidazolecarboxamide formyltransferase/IMP cyclohydrolase [Capnocytophaga sp.]|uniref:bifunctional phosphoribosylaminoimidazolecarboxamide formyltransferase/IMP cyclohydrolase n=1 Tax=Capnocytophaga sp. TaxID=44737 RepID=UPI0026DD19D2|nr:bifunctional phosphoribosylaminoimidazolecarboxamide formyltransferase/IMP cyclohydrolase [Capnocytophaga sp.]MDO5105581.1 bifunctional phosphoribosylaminoimidazolecarboxamide formyltransferase/IMP cyclohydrolase [Capnocytophaga sp.]
MELTKQAKSALISVFDKTGLEPIIHKMNSLGITIYSTGGTEAFIKSLGVEVIPVETVTEYPSIFGGRVKTLHPKIFGGILNRQDNDSDVAEMIQYAIPQLDIVIVDLYPFEKTVASGATESEIIEKIDIGGISLIRAAAKNFKDVLCVSSVEQYPQLLDILVKNQAKTTLEQRKYFAAQAFKMSSHYDTAIFNYFNQTEAIPTLKISEPNGQTLRYGENPHQKGYFYGNFEALFDKLHGKELSYNNLLDVDAAVNLIAEFKNEDPTFAILKHNNACGVATRKSIREAYGAALAGDPVSAFGGILISNTKIDSATAGDINSLFFEVIIAPSYSDGALEILMQKKNRIILVQKNVQLPQSQVRSCLNGYLLQDKDLKTDTLADVQYVTEERPDQQTLDDLFFASKICKHTKSNTIVLAKNKQLLASGTGQTSRVDALRQAIEKARSCEFDLNGAVMASDAFFPFPDCVEIAGNAGITSVIQPGGSVKDQLSIDYCNAHQMAMIFTGIRHFKH